MIKILHSYGLPAAMAVLIGLSSYRYEERSQNLPGGNDSHLKTGMKRFIHSGNIHKSGVQLEK